MISTKFDDSDDEVALVGSDIVLKRNTSVRKEVKLCPLSLVDKFCRFLKSISLRASGNYQFCDDNFDSVCWLTNLPNDDTIEVSIERPIEDWDTVPLVHFSHINDLIKVLHSFKVTTKFTFDNSGDCITVVKDKLVLMDHKGDSVIIFLEGDLKNGVSKVIENILEAKKVFAKISIEGREYVPISDGHEVSISATLKVAKNPVVFGAKASRIICKWDEIESLIDALKKAVAAIPEKKKGTTTRTIIRAINRALENPDMVIVFFDDSNSIVKRIRSVLAVLGVVDYRLDYEPNSKALELTIRKLK